MFLQLIIIYLDDYVLSTETIRLRRQQFREEIAAELKSNYAPTGILEVHWDGKLLPDLTGNVFIL